MTSGHFRVSRLQVTFEDKKRENFERGNLELEKRRQALLEQQRKEQERLAQLERAEQERKERERQEQERKRQLELEKQLEKQRELERQREEERRKEIERREVSRHGDYTERMCSCFPSSLISHRLIPSRAFSLSQKEISFPYGSYSPSPSPPGPRQARISFLSLWVCS